MSASIFPTLCNTLYSKNSKYTICNIDIRGALFFCMRLCKEMMKKTLRDRKCEIMEKN